MFKEFLMKKMLKSQLKGVPEAEQERIMHLVLKNPELFKKIGEEIQAKTKGGMDQMMASMSVMKKYENEIRNAMK